MFEIGGYNVKGTELISFENYRKPLIYKDIHVTRNCIFNLADYKDRFKLYFHIEFCISVNIIFLVVDILNNIK